MVCRVTNLYPAAVLVLAAPGAAQDPDSALATNPFDRPAFVVNLRDAAAPGPMTPPVRLDLRTTMVGKDAAMANINGQILSVGDTFDGYRVASIREGRVILTKDGERIALDVYATQRGEDEERNELQR